MRRILLSLTATLLPLVASAASDDGQALSIARFWFEHDKSFGCVNSNGSAIRCKISKDTTFEVFHAPNQKHALVVVTYLPDVTGNAVQTAAMLTKEAEETGGWEVKRHVVGVGQDPSNIKFLSKNVSFVSKFIKSGDARMDPTGRKTFTIAY
jgi:hypothetical protein